MKDWSCPALACLALLSLPMTACIGGADLDTEPSDATVVGITAKRRTRFVQTEVQAANAALTDALRAEKYGEMKASPFAFFRGTDHLYWKDLGQSPDLSTYGGQSATRAWIGGDMHVDNTGAFDDDEGTIVFAINDFDEAIIADYQLDV